MNIIDYLKGKGHLNPDLDTEKIRKAYNKEVDNSDRSALMFEIDMEQSMVRFRDGHVKVRHQLEQGLIYKIMCDVLSGRMVDINDYDNLRQEGDIK